MQEVNLGKTNEEITWKRNDEIGGLVKEYNKMVNKAGGERRCPGQKRKGGGLAGNGPAGGP